LDCDEIVISLDEGIDPESIDLSTILRHEINRCLDRHMVFSLCRVRQNSMSCCAASD
jgi:hypothetical protein